MTEKTNLQKIIDAIGRHRLLFEEPERNRVEAIAAVQQLHARVAELEAKLIVSKGEVIHYRGDRDRLRALATPRSKSGPPDEPCEVLLVSRGQWSGTGFIGGPLTGWLPMPAPPATEDEGCVLVSPALKEGTE